MEANPLDPIRHMVNAGDLEGARQALAELLEVEPNNTDAWALLAILLPHPADQAQCYREILRINPNDRQAAVWLASLTGRTAEQPAGSQPSSREGSDSQPAFAQGEMDRMLGEVILPGSGDEDLQPLLGRGTPPRQTEPQGFLDGLLGRFRGKPAVPDPEDNALVFGQEEPQSAAGALSPELILRLAGGPLAPEERRNCPACDAVVSRRETRCPWCSAPLPGAESQ